MKTLGLILKEVPALSFSQFPKSVLDQSVSAITSDSRQVREGGIFFAIAGETTDGHQFLESVQAQKPCLMIGTNDPTSALTVPYLKVKDAREAMAWIACAFYDHPSRTLKMIGVTGTSGKTTSAFLLNSIFKKAGHKTGLIGTVENRIGDRAVPSTLTTPGSIELQALLGQMRDEQCEWVIMEVSSHALKQKRTLGIAFDGMLFTNLSREHLDYHPTMEDYFDSKSLLFTEYVTHSWNAGKSPVVVINPESEYGEKMLVITANYSKTPALLMETSSWAKATLNGIEGMIDEMNFCAPLFGQFNVENICGVVDLAFSLGVSENAIVQALENDSKVPGRLEVVPNSLGIQVLVDYAHKPDALEKVSQTLRDLISKENSNAKLITVFGCGGNRDRSKRPVMGEIALRLSDFVIVTSDNPRDEDPNGIIAEIVSGMRDRSKFEVEPDRHAAIEKALKQARKNDFVLIAGKGHETYQLIQGVKTEFDDRLIARKILEKLK